MKIILFFNVLTIVKFIILFFTAKNVFYVIKLRLKKTVLLSAENCRNFCTDTFELKKYKLLKKLNISYILSQNEAVLYRALYHW